ncbi:MAG: HD domain-containing phosphohydrolase, partial [Jaaginema sp. PMC 1079.18]|nr:HD domain-containing phosphohydrolase [Jaaginema sp. PMC 1079.18]
MSSSRSPIPLNDSLRPSTDMTQAELVEKLLAIGTALSSTHNLKELLDLILSKSREITCSDAGSVYLIDHSEKEPKLVFKVAQNDSLPNTLFHEFSVPITPESLAGYVALTGRSLNLDDAYTTAPGLPYKLDQNFDRDFNYRTQSVLVLPMQDADGEIIGVLQLLNRKVKSNINITPQNVAIQTQSYSDWEERIVRSLASQAAISIERNLLQNSIENLFEGFVTASVRAIESRDPTTSGHSDRVAALTVRLAEAVNDVYTGPLQVYQFGDRQLRELRYAALLHDFGKLSIPEAILNKRKKLYPHDLEGIRHRFAVIQRTLEMECAQAKYQYLIEHPHAHQSSPSCPHCTELKKLDGHLAEAIATLQEYLQFVETLNEPLAIASSSYPIAEINQKLYKLASYTYRDIDGKLHPLITPSELEQLQLPRGNLTATERLAIEAHVTHSYEFLKRIPWTKNLENIPEIAYGHHEKLDGSGYPRGLKKEQLSMQTQIMIIADIYDALTAADRPYKRSLPLDITLHILDEEAAKGKINTDLVKLFIERQIYNIT